MADAGNENEQQNIDTIINDLTERKNGTNKNKTNNKLYFIVILVWSSAFN